MVARVITAIIKTTVTESKVIISITTATIFIARFIEFIISLLKLPVQKIVLRLRVKVIAKLIILVY